MSRASSYMVKLIMALCLLVVVVQADALSAVTRAVLGQILSLTPVEFDLDEDLIRVGRVEAPWSEDCSGLPALALYVALLLWWHWERPLDLALLLRLLAAPFAALLVNVGRVSTILYYRSVFYPVEEPVELHFLMGFVWMLPILSWATCGQMSLRRPGCLLDMLSLSAVFSILIPLADEPSGGWVAMTSLLVLFIARSEPRGGDAFGGVVAVAWVCVGLTIALARMESLWLPWLLLNPQTAPRSRAGLLPTAALLPGTVPLLTHSETVLAVNGMGMALAAFHFLRLQDKSPGSSAQAPPIPSQSAASRIMAAAMTMLPFIPVGAITSQSDAMLPPRGCMVSPLTHGVQELRLPLQPTNITIHWISGVTGDRHHALTTCMRYRGVKLEKLDDCEKALTDGTYWRREFFLVGEELKESYRDYLKATFIPGAPTGAHLVISAVAGSMRRDVFSARALEIAEELQAMASQ